VRINRNIFKESFRAKTFIRALVLIIVVSVSFTVIFVRHQGKSLKDAMINEGLSLAELVSYNAKLGVFTENPKFLEDTLNGIMKHEGITLCKVFSLDGRVLDERGNADETNIDKKMVEKLIETGNSQYLESPNHFEFWSPIISDSGNFSEAALFYDEPDNDSEMIGFLLLVMSKEQIKKSFRGLVTNSFFTGTVFLVIGSIFAFFLSRNVTAPVKRLSERIQDVGEGNLEIEVPVETDDEIGKLAGAFNRMTEKLKRREREKQRLIEQLGQSQKLEAIGTLAGGIAHDFNNILAVLLSNLEMAKEKAPEYLRDYLDTSLTTIERGSDIVKRLLDFSHKRTIKCEPVNVSLIVQEAVSILREKMDPRIKVQFDIEADLWKARAMAGDLQQVIMNLVANARDAIMEHMEETDRMDTPSAIEISMSNIEITEEAVEQNPQASAGNYIRISIKDNGCGMDRQTRLHVFDPFYTTKMIDKGTGLGLSSVYGIVKSYKGWIDVWSEPGEGSVFEVYFPRFKGEVEGKTRESEVPVNVNGNEVILLVDDEKHLIGPIKEKLEDLGYEVFLAEDGEAAMDILKKENIDLVLLDYVMPGISGLDVIKYMKNTNINAKVIMYTGKDLSRLDHILEGIEVINKPCSFDILVSRIRSALGFKPDLPLKATLSRVKHYYIKDKTSPYNGELTNTADAYKMFKHLINEPRENFIALFLDSHNKILAFDTLSSGTTDETAVYPKEVVRTALLTNASSVILIHNHPSGDLNASEKDIIVTAAVVQACQVMDIHVLDHLIISNEGYFSFYQEELM
jgi:signal transduction histidine kinase/DNA repair protein RadC